MRHDKGKRGRGGKGGGGGGLGNVLIKSPKKWTKPMIGPMFFYDLFTLIHA